jgi:CheY-like chemotaxis protein
VLPLAYGKDDAHAAAAAEPGRPRALLVDDEEPFRYVLRHIAEGGGFAVLEASDGEHALEIARAERPDVVLLDLQMPRMDGFSALAEMSRDPQLRGTPVIVCTSLALDLEQKRSLAAAHAIVSKHDISREALASLMQAAVRAHGEAT